MLLLSNGNFKSGSTWVTGILRVGLNYNSIPVEYWHPKHKDRLHLKLLDQFMEEHGNADALYISKSHIFEPDQVECIRANKNIVVVNVERSLPDAILSHYHHLRRLHKAPENMRLYFSLIGKYKAMQMMDYRRRWGFVSDRNIRVQYEDLLEDPDAQISRLLACFGQYRNDVADVAERTSLASLRTKSSEYGLNEPPEFFRRGVSGEGAKVFGQDVINEIMRIERGQYSSFERLAYFILFEQRVRFKRWLADNFKSLYLFIDKRM